MKLEKSGFQYSIIFICILGVLVRFYAYFRNISFWHDEAALAINIMCKPYLDLFKGLDYLQVAPPLFLVMTKFLYRLIHSDSVYIRDLILRLIPLVSGIAAIPLFYALLKRFVKDKFSILTGLFIFVFNTTTILYCAQFKQYSLELLVSIILMLIFYKILFEGKFRWYYAAIIAAAPWFSLSSLFIIGSYFFLVLYKNPKLIIKSYLPFFASIIWFYFFSLKYVSNYNYSGMYNWWQNGYGFVSLNHPARIVIRFGELFCFNKFIAEAVGFFVLLTAISAIFPLKKDDILRKLYIYLPIFLTFSASALKLYPIEARLILFLFPLFVIALAGYSLKYKKTILTLICLLSFLSSIFYTIRPVRFLTSAREAVIFVQKQIKPNEVIILDNTFVKYLYYINNKNHIIFLKNDCSDVYRENCNKELDTLPKGVYYLILKKDPEEKLSKNINILEKYNAYSTVIKFEK